MTVEQFIERAIEGGWIPKSMPSIEDKPFSQKVQAVQKIKFIERVFLDPLAWQAVGKVMKNERRWRRDIHDKEGLPDIPAWHWHMRHMIDALAEGKSLEEYIATL